MLLLTLGVHLVLKDWERADHRLDESLDLALAVLQIERALQGAFPHYYLKREENKKYLFFEGGEEELSWVSTVSPGRQPGLTAWQIKSPKGEGVELRTIPAFASDPTEALKKATVIMTFKGYSAVFEYLYLDEQFTKDTKWLKEWSAKKLQGLPRAVRIHLEKDAQQDLEIIAVINASEHQMLRPIKP